MANKILHSSQVTFLDRTDERKLDVYISSNHPTVQIKNQNTGEYTPDWSKVNLQLSAEVYIDSQDITNNPQTTLNWYTKIDNQETLVGNGKTFVVSTNVLSSNPIVAYVCKAKYQNIDAISQITFTRTDTGLNGIDGVNGTDGAPAPAVKAQYSISGESGWDATLNASIHKYIRYSYDGGNTWTVAIKMVGEDGTSVNIKGTATSKTAVSGTSYYTLVYDSATIAGATMGDAYLLDGDLYVCVDSRSGNDYFMNVGKIQGPAGNDGRSSYVFIRYATDANGSNMTDSPSSTTTHIGICTVNTNVAPITPSSYIWSKFVGDNAKSIILNGSSQIFKVDSSSAYSPTTITVTAQAINITIAKWEYSINGGASWLSDAPSGVFLNSSTNTITVTGANLDSNSIVIRASNGPYSDTYTVYKVFDGINGTIGKPGDPASMAFLTNENISFSANTNGQISSTSFTTNVVAYTGTTKVTPTIGTVTGLPAGMTVLAPKTTENEQILTFSIANNSTLGSASSNNGTITIPIISPVSTNLKLSWSKINTGATGVGINSTQVKYGISASATVQPTVWYDSLPVAKDGEYLWTQTIIDYTDPSKEDTVTYTYAKQGTTGEKGNPGTSVEVSSIQYQEGSSATTAPTGTWQNAVVAVADGKYLWTKTTFSDGKISYGVAKQGVQGRGILNITEYYLASTAASGVTIETVGWTTTMQTLTDTNKYLWNYQLITYTDNTTDTTNPVITGVYGDIGAPGLPGLNAVTFQIYSSNGYALSINNPTVTLQTFSYIGDIKITAGATYQWYSYNDTGWVEISGETNAYLTITRQDVAFSESYMCKMTFDGVEYISVATIDDKNDDNKVFTTKPSNYVAGDLWIVGVDYIPSGVEVGTLLIAEHTNITYEDSDWVTATKYDDKINELQDNIAIYNQYFSFDSTEGLKISAKDDNGTQSQFSTSLTNERLSFNYANEAIAYIDGTKMNIKEAVIESPLTVTGKYSGSTMLQAPVINIGNFSIIVESNGSLSIVANT